MFWKKTIQTYMTQQELILEYLSEYTYIIPAKMTGKEYKGGFFGSEISRACRYLRKAKILDSVPGRFEVFYLKGFKPKEFNTESYWESEETKEQVLEEEESDTVRLINEMSKNMHREMEWDKERIKRENQPTLL